MTGPQAVWFVVFVGTFTVTFVPLWVVLQTKEPEYWPLLHSFLSATLVGMIVANIVVSIWL